MKTMPFDSTQRIIHSVKFSGRQNAQLYGCPVEAVGRNALQRRIMVRIQIVVLVEHIISRGTANLRRATMLML